MIRPFTRVFLASVLAALAVPALAFAAQPKVLAIHFDTEVNPVTSSYLDHQLQRAQDGHYSAAVILIDTPTRCARSSRRRSRSRSR